VKVCDVKLDGRQGVGDVEAGEANLEVSTEPGERHMAPIFLPERDEVSPHVLHRRDGEPF